MRALIVPPAVILVLATVTLGAALLLDTGSGAQRDAALVIGTAAFWALAIGTMWLITTVAYRAYQHRRSS